MRYVVRVCLMGFVALIFGVGVLLAIADDSLEAFDPLHPSTILPILANGVRALHAQVREGAQGLVEVFAGPQRERVKRHLPIEGLPQ